MVEPARVFMCATVLGLGCANPATERPKPDEPAAHSDATLELELRVTRHKISGKLRNVGEAPTPVLHDARLQPSRPVLRDANGTTIEPFDDRTREKFDNTVYESMFVILDPGASLPIGSGELERDDSGWILTWGEFRYSELASGSYEMELVWTSSVEQATNDDDMSIRQIPDVWLGELRSSAQTLRLP